MGVSGFEGAEEEEIPVFARFVGWAVEGEGAAVVDGFGECYERDCEHAELDVSLGPHQYSVIV